MTKTIKVFLLGVILSLGAVVSCADEYVLVKQNPEETGEYTTHIVPDPAVCNLYGKNINYFAKQNIPMSCNRPIAPLLKNRIQTVEWENLAPVDYPELFRQLVLFNSQGRDKSLSSLKTHEERLATGEFLFRRAKITLSGNLQWHGYIYDLTPPRQFNTGEFYIIQYGRDNTNTNRSINPCKAVRGNISLYEYASRWNDYAQDLAMYEVDAEMNAVINELTTLERGVRGEHLRLIDGKLYVEKNDTDASIYLLRVNLNFPVFLEPICKYRFNQSGAR